MGRWHGHQPLNRVGAFLGLGCSMEMLLRLHPNFKTIIPAKHPNREGLRQKAALKSWDSPGFSGVTQEIPQATVPTGNQSHRRPGPQNRVTGNQCQLSGFSGIL